MINKKSVLAIIPARGGSKGLKNKNIKKIYGKPLIAWSIKRCQESKYIDKFIVSTNDLKIKKISEAYGCEVPFLRPERYSIDSSPTSDVVIHAINFYKKKKINYDYIVLVEPTSPIRLKSDIDMMLKKLDKKSNAFDSIISIGAIKHHPSNLKKIKGEKLNKFLANMKIKNRRQDEETLYFPFGVSYIAKTKNYINKKTFYLKRSTFFKIKDYQCYEIDDIYDFVSIESILRKIKFR